MVKICVVCETEFCATHIVSLKCTTNAFQKGHATSGKEQTQRSPLQRPCKPHREGKTFQDRIAFFFMAGHETNETGSDKGSRNPRNPRNPRGPQNPLGPPEPLAHPPSTARGSHHPTATPLRHQKPQRQDASIGCLQTQEPSPTPHGSARSWCARSPIPFLALPLTPPPAWSRPESQ